MSIIFILLSIIFAFTTIFYRTKYIITLSKKNNLHQEINKLTHFLRTSLSTILTGTLGIKKYLPTLLRAYNDGINNSNISPVRFSLLAEAIENIEIAVKKTTIMLENFKQLN